MTAQLKLPLPIPDGYKLVFRASITLKSGIHFMHYNFGRIHKTLRVTPAMEAGIADHAWSATDIAELADRFPRPPN